jgi:helix-turn-helix protein
MAFGRRREDAFEFARPIDSPGSMTNQRFAVVSAIAAEIDRLVVRGHEVAHEYPDKPPELKDRPANPPLLPGTAVVLLAQPLAREDFKGIVPYAPHSLIDGLIDNNIDEGIVVEESGRLALTDTGRAFAEAFVKVQEDSVARAWSAAGEDVQTIERILRPVVERAQTITPPRTPSDFALFAPHHDRETSEGSVLRLITAIRYWRADAHLSAIDSAGLDRPEAHALNVLWDASRGVERVGQGFPKPGRRGTASLEERGLASDGKISAEGVALREKIEEETDRLTASLYDELDETTLHELLHALQALPGDAAPGIPGT